MFDDQTLGQLPRRVLVSSFDLDNDPVRDPDETRTWKPKFFHNYPGSGSDAAQKIVDVALRTANAPTYFPIYQGYIDGGVVANNPSMCALAQALDEGTGGQHLGDIALLSISTGSYPKYLTSQDGDWGWAQWARPIIEIMFEGSVGVADYQCQRLLGIRYQRLNPILPAPISMDAVDQIPTLVQIAQSVNLEKTIIWLSRYFHNPI
jgi:hypothetical protein